MKAEYSDLLIKKGEIYKEHIGNTRAQIEANSLKDCTFKPVLNNARNKRSGSKSKIRELIKANRNNSSQRRMRDQQIEEVNREISAFSELRNNEEITSIE